MEDSSRELLEMLASIIAKAIAASTKEANFGAREYVDWMFNHNKKNIAFKGQLLELHESKPSYYSASYVMNLACTDQQLAVVLNNFRDLGYEITSWQPHKDTNNRDEDLCVNYYLDDMDKYKQLLNNYPPVVIRTRDEAYRVSSLIAEIEEASDFPQEIDCYLSLLKLLLNDWESYQVSRDQQPFQQQESPEGIPF